MRPKLNQEKYAILASLKLGGGVGMMQKIKEQNGETPLRTGKYFE